MVVGLKIMRNVDRADSQRVQETFRRKTQVIRNAMTNKGTITSGWRESSSSHIVHFEEQ